MAKQRPFADLLKRLRAESGLSQPALAERAGLSVSTIRQYEYGLREPSYTALVQLAGALNLSLGAFSSPVPLPATEASRKKRAKKKGG